MAKKLLHVITAKKNSNNLTKILLDAGFYITVMEASGGFTKEKFSIIMLGLEEEKVDEVVKLARNCCQKHDVQTVNNVPIPTLGQEDMVQSQTTKTVKINVGGVTILISPLGEIRKV
ncbi:cyclic-di-AMP receptor [Patescibacteria group bacterium]